VEQLSVRNDELKACLADRDRLIAAFRERCQKLEADVAACREALDTYAQLPANGGVAFVSGFLAQRTLAALDEKEGG
jgi:hypothetical protein